MKVEFPDSFPVQEIINLAERNGLRVKYSSLDKISLVPRPTDSNVRYISRETTNHDDGPKAA